MNRRPRRLLLAAVLTLVLTGCAGPDLATTTAERLQADVVGIGTAAASGDLSAAVAAADALDTRLTAATDAGSVSADRAARIRAALERVRADLEAMMVPAQTEPAESEPVAPETPVVDTPVVEEPAQPDEGPGEKEKGKPGPGDKEHPGKGKDKGKGKGD